ncbi:MAG: GGDEF domain-containing protein [Gammaproteobacteria bacterium]|nr:GGDEF domain-containing protein [Gammaproteobacteria bacterium]
MLSIWNAFGAIPFSESNIFLVAAMISLFVALPTTYFMGHMIYQLSISQADLRRLAETDDLTGLTNRRSFFKRAKHRLDAAQAIGSPIALLVIDADYFKQLNDTYGHATGDAALKFISEKLEYGFRNRDLACRLGGEEFAVLVPGLTAQQAESLSTRFLESIASQPMVCDNKIIEMSVSCGIADTDVGYDMTRLFKAADEALYAAKAAGRNQTVLYSSEQFLSREPART